MTLQMLSRFFRPVLIAVFLVCGVLAAGAGDAAQTHKIGILATRSKEQTLAQWQSLAQALKTALPDRDFVVLPLDTAELEKAVASRQLDFVLTNPSLYVLLASRSGLSAPLATLVTDLRGQKTTVYGGVIFTRADRTGISKLEDVRGKTVAAVDKVSLGGYQLQALEFQKAGLQLADDTRLITTGLPADLVVKGVMSGRADVGFVRTGILESLAFEGKLDLDQVRIINRQDMPGFPVALSTGLYPEWPLAALPHVDEEVARKVTAALFLMQKDNPVNLAMGFRGFSIPADYNTVTDAMRELRVPPFDAAPHFTIRDVWVRYRLLLALGMGTMAVVVLLAIGLLITKSRLQDEKAAALRQSRRLEESEERFRRLFEDSGQAVMLIEDGHFVAANRATLAMLRMERLEQLLGRTPDEFSPEFQPDGRLSTQKATDAIATAFRLGSNEFEWVHLRADGEPFTARVLLTPIRQGDKDLIHVVWSDITKQKEAEREVEEYRHALERRVEQRTAELAAATQSLNESNERLEAIFDGANAGIMLLRDRKIQQFNRRLEVLTGYSAAELSGMPTELLYADRAAWQVAGEEIYRCVAEGKPYVRDHLARRKDGSTFWVSLSASAIEADDLGKGVVGMMEDISTKKQAEQALKESEERQSYLLKLSDALANLIEPDRIETEACHVLGEHLGASRVLYAEFMADGKSVGGPQYTNGVPPTGSAWRTDDYDASLVEKYRRGEAVSCDDVMQNPALSDRQKAAYAAEQVAAWAAVPIVKKDRPIGRLIVHQNRPRAWTAGDLGLIRETLERIWSTLERRRAELALRERDEQLRIALDAGKMGVWNRDTLAGKLVWSDQLYRVLGYEPRSFEPTIDHWFNRVHPDDLPDFRAKIKICRETGADLLAIYRVIHVDNRVRWVEMRGKFEAARDGKPLRSYGVARDITDEREAADALAMLVDEQQAVFNAATVGIILTRDRVILRCNRTMEQLFGYEPDELVGKTTRVLYPDDATYGETSDSLMKGLLEEGVYKEERQLLRKDGSSFWCRKTVRTVDQHDLSKGFAGTFEDTTAEHVAMAEMARARTLAEDAARTKAEFLANMSHEIRTPMNSIMGMTHLALRTHPPVKVRDYLLKIQASSQHLLGVINDILDFSKLEADRMTIEHVPFDLQDVLDDVANVLSDKAARKGLELIFNAAADIPLSLIGDPLRIEQVLINLVGNAVKFTEHGEVSLNVTVADSANGEAMLRFAVRDSGIGISEDQRARLFQSFQQADASTTRKYGGSGLGLAICKRLAELMGGQVGVESTPGVGSTFWFTARMGIGKDTAPRYHIHPDLRGMNLLVVDDNEQARQVILEMLRAMGFEVTAVASGAQALSEIDRAEAAGRWFDILFVDWKMPEMDGIELARQVQRKPLKKSPVVLMITAFDRDEVLKSAEGVGVRAVLVKPITPSGLFNSIMDQFGKRVELPPSSNSGNADILPETPELAGARALLVEDNEINLEVAIEFLNALGLETEIAENGAIALQKLQYGHYDVVLMDMQMPVMDGLTATREIRKNPAWRNLPIVAMTANAMAGDRERCLEAGMNDHIPKPIDPVQLLAALKRWVTPDPRRMPVKPAAAAPPPPSAGTAQANLDGIDGLDARLGLSQAMGREALYLDLLSKFAAGQEDAPSRIAQAVSEARWADAERLAHTLKGVAAQIGADAVRVVAAKFEHALHLQAPADVLQPLQAEVAMLVPRLAEEIRNRLRAGTPQPAAAVSGSENWPAIRERLVRLLQDSDAESVEYFEENDAVLRPALGADYEKMAEAMRSFDLSQALEVLRAAGPA